MHLKGVGEEHWKKAEDLRHSTEAFQLRTRLAEKGRPSTSRRRPAAGRSCQC